MKPGIDRDNWSGNPDVGGNFVGAMHSDPQPTERAAAVAQLPKSGTDRRRVYDFLCARRPSGATDYEGALATGLRLYTYAPRRNELLKGGLVEDSGERRPTDSGSPAIVWRAA